MLVLGKNLSSIWQAFAAHANKIWICQSRIVSNTVAGFASSFSVTDPPLLRNEVIKAIAWLRQILRNYL